MINPVQLRDLVLKPVLQAMALNVANMQSAVELCMGTFMQESALVALHQYGAGPAVGIGSARRPVVGDGAGRVRRRRRGAAFVAARAPDGARRPSVRRRYPPRRDDRASSASDRD